MRFGQISRSSWMTTNYPNSPHGVGLLGNTLPLSSMSKKFSSKADLQSDSNALTQLELPIARKPSQAALAPEIIARQPDMLGAVNLAIQASGLADKQVYGVLDIDAATFSKIRSRQAYFPACKLDQLLDIVSNDIPLQWWAARRGYELKPLRSELERRVVELEAQLAQAERDKLVILDFVKQARGP